MSLMPSNSSCSSDFPYTATFAVCLSSEQVFCSDFKGLLCLQLDSKSIWFYMAVSINWGSTKMDGLYWKILLKWMIWGYPKLWKPPCLSMAIAMFLRDGKAHGRGAASTTSWIQHRSYLASNCPWFPTGGSQQPSWHEHHPYIHYITCIFVCMYV